MTVPDDLPTFYGWIGKIVEFASLGLLGAIIGGLDLLEERYSKLRYVFKFLKMPFGFLFAIVLLMIIMF